MLRKLWDRIMGRSVERAEHREEERERMSPAERSFTRQSVEDHQADEFVDEHLGGREPHFDEDDPRRE